MNILHLDLDAEFSEESLNLEVDILMIYSDYDALKAIFRASVGLYKETEKIYTLEEFATEHIDLIKDQVSLYNHTLILENGTSFSFLGMFLFVIWSLRIQNDFTKILLDDRRFWVSQDWTNI